MKTGVRYNGALLHGGLLRRLYHRWSLKLFFSELLAKRWMEPVIPFLLMLALIAYFAAVTPHYASIANATQLSRQFAEMGFVVMAMAVVLISGGIDLSVGSVFAFANLTALALFHIFHLPVPVVIVGTLAAGAGVGLINGLLIGYLKARPFLTTLVTLIILRAVVDLLAQRYAVPLAMGGNLTLAWSFLGNGRIYGIPSNLLVLGLVGGLGHFMLSRSRPGWHLTALGSSRKAARHAGIAVERTLCLTYVTSGLLAALGGLFYAARLSSTGSDTGVGWEVNALTAAVLGGVSLAGGRGTIARAMIGAVIVFVLVNGMVRTGLPGALTSTALGAILLLAVGIDVKWAKNRLKTLQKIYLNPTVVELPPPPATARGSGTPYAENDRLRESLEIGLDQVEGPEDVILDREDRLYCGTRDGLILRFSGPRFEQREVFARIGGRPLGMAFDADGNLIVCVGGMGLYGVTPAGEVYTLTDQTNRSWFKLNDDARLRHAFLATLSRPPAAAETAVAEFDARQVDDFVIRVRIVGEGSGAGGAPAAGHARVAAALRTPVQLGENWFGLREMGRALDLAACDLVMPDIMKIGGVSAFREAAALASLHSLPVSSHLFHEVTAHLMTVIQTPHYLEVMELAAAVLQTPMRFEDGHAVLPSGPGNGLAWDPAAVARYRLN